MHPKARNRRDPLIKMLNKIRTNDPNLANQLSQVDINWYRIKNANDSEAADIYVYDEIMPKWMAEWFGGVSAEGMIEQLNSIGAKTINVHLNCPGGDLFESIAIFNALVSHSATINVYVDALAASGASIIAMAGDNVTMMVGSQMMIHDALGLEMGNPAQLREFADFLDKQSDNIASIYANKAGGSIEDWRAKMVAETWMTAAEAVELGLANEVYSKPDMPPPTAPEEEEEEGNDEEAPMDDEEIENLMRQSHSLANRGFKFAGRRRAPSPIENDVDGLLNEIFAGRK